MNKGTLIIISGPSGSGKDTVLTELFKKMPELEFSISSVSRSMRPGEVNGQKYNFISREQFKSMIDNDMLLEYNEYCGNFYGTPRQPVESCIESDCRWRKTGWHIRRRNWRPAHPYKSDPPPGRTETGEARTASGTDRKSTRLNSSHLKLSRMPSSA